MLQRHFFCFQLQHRINRNDLPETGGRRMKKTLSGSTPQLVHHGVAALKFSEAEQARRAIVAKYLSPPPAALSAHDAQKVSNTYHKDHLIFISYTYRCSHKLTKLITRPPLRYKR